MENIRSELEEHPVNAVEKFFDQWTQIRKNGQMQHDFATTATIDALQSGVIKNMG